MKFTEIIERTNLVFGFKVDKDLAQLLEISQQNFSNKKKKGTLLTELVEIVSKLHPKVNLDWLINGRGLRYVSDVDWKADYSKNNPSPLDPVLLKQILNGVENYLDEQNWNLATELKTKVIALLYDHYAETGDDVEQRKVVDYLKLVA